MANSGNLPDWLPEAARSYLLNIGGGVPIREIARQTGRNASTISRQVQKIEMRRDDLLIDSAFARLERRYFPDMTTKEYNNMANTPAPSEARINREARRILRRLCEPETFLLIAEQADQAAVFKAIVPGKHTKIANCDREIAEAFAIKDWIKGDYIGAVGKFGITEPGRTALKRMLSEDRSSKISATTPFQEQHKDFGERIVRSYNGSGTESLRFNLAESPLTLLARKKDRGGSFYLTPDLLEAGERFRADFESAQLGPRVAQNWDRFMTSGASNGWSTGSEGSTAAHERFSRAMDVLGPGLGDIALRVCCFLEGMEKAEKRLGWSARSGKVVLKIALQRLAIHYGITLAEAEERAG